MLANLLLFKMMHLSLTSLEEKNSACLFICLVKAVFCIGPQQLFELLPTLVLLVWRLVLTLQYCPAYFEL